MNRREAVQALMALPASATISRAEVKTTDVIVIESEAILSIQARENIRQWAAQVWPHNQIVVLDRGLKLKIVSQTN